VDANRSTRTVVRVGSIRGRGSRMRWEKALWAGLVVSVVAVGPALAQTAATATNKSAGGAAAAASARAAASPPSAAGSASAAAAPGAAPTTSAAPLVAGPASPTPRAASSGVDGATYAVRLKDLEQRIDELKEQIRRSHTRL